MIYFDVTDVVHFATRYNRLTGIQRVQVNIVGLLARKHGAEAIRCLFFDGNKQALFEFSPLGHFDSREFDAENFFAAIGGSRGPTRFPSSVQVKSYLRRYNNNKLLRALKKVEIYASALLLPRRLERIGLSIQRPARMQEVAVTPISKLPPGSSFVCLGSMWQHPEVWRVAQAHRAGGGDVVQMVHDLIPVVFPQYYSKEESRVFDVWLKSALHYVSRFITVSQWTARDLRQYAERLGQEPTIRAIPLAHEFLGYERNANIDASAQLSDLTGVKFALCVGTVEHRKNQIALLRAWSVLAKDIAEKLPLLVFAGKFGKGSDEFQQLLEGNKDLERFIRIIHGPTDGDLAWLYRNSAFTMYPSTYEGWGLPVGESAWFGKYCITSTASSIPEVCGSLLEYVDPADEAALQAAIKQMLIDPQLLARREAAIAAATLRRWSDVADELREFVANKTAPAR